jgi:hypothetical protein
MYKVSPKPKPIMPLKHARTTAYAGKLIKAPNLPIIAKQATRIMLVHTRRTMLAETGLALNNALLYIMADIVQQIAAPKAESSPIIVLVGLPDPLRKILLYAVKYLMAS